MYAVNTNVVGIPQRLLTNEDLAQLMGWTVRAIYARRHRGASLPPAITIGKVVRYRPEDVEAWLDAHTQDTDNAISTG